MDKKTRLFVITEISQSFLLKEKLLEDEFVNIIYNIGRAIIRAFRNNRKAILFGNGGSAADAQHITAELVGRYQCERIGLPAIALTTNTSSLTAIGNDYSFQYIFARQIVALGQKGDVAIGITTSGKSLNVIEGLKEARHRGLTTVALTGKGGESLRKMVDYCLCVPSTDTPRIQEVHILIGHILCGMVERSLFKVK
uniref:Phosphoheptose isomerase n=1 Tax=candidate division WOR-3 bacterium TaxID=2052148 RepID=A0A7C4TG16_UNCW3